MDVLLIFESGRGVFQCLGILKELFHVVIDRCSVGQMFVYRDQFGVGVC